MKADSKHHSLCSIKVRLFANSQCLSTALEHNQLFYVHQWHDGILSYNAASAPNVSLHYSYNQSLYELLFNALFNYCIYPIHPNHCYWLMEKRIYPNHMWLQSSFYISIPASLFKKQQSASTPTLKRSWYWNLRLFRKHTELSF